MDTSKRPQITANRDGIPQGLTSEPRWIVWRYDDDGKKPPYDFRTGRLADANDPQVWTTFDEAWSAYERDGYSGVGFALNGTDSWLVVDLDAVRDVTTGEITRAAQQIIASLNSYTEVSPSGDGVKIFVRAGMGPGLKKKTGVEILTSNYATVTGHHLAGTPLTLESRGPEVYALAQQEFGVKEPKRRPAKKVPDEILGGSRNNTLFSQGCRLRQQGHSLKEITALLLAMNAERVQPPLDDEEVEKIAESASRYKATDGFNAGDEDLKTLVPKVWESLREANDPPRLLLHGPDLVRVDRDPRNRNVVLDELDRDRLFYEVANETKWYRTIQTDNGFRQVTTKPPEAVIRFMRATPAERIPLPSVTRVIHAPILASDGTLDLTRGYQERTGCYYEPAADLRVPPIPDAPTDDDIARARSLILDDLLVDFPFTSPAERAHAVALLIVPFVRELIDGPTPLHVIEKPITRTGATLLTDVLMIPSLGGEIAKMVEAENDAEWRKRITSTLRSGPSAILIDNVRQALDSAALAAVLTCTSWVDRLLGESTNVGLPNRAVWIATGNNPIFSSEITLRVVRIRLDAQVEDPWNRVNRAQFKHVLPDWATQHRGELIWAALTLARAWLAAGRPLGKTVLSAAPAWSRVMGGILGNAGIDGFLGNLDEVRVDSDTEADSLRDFVGRWYREHKFAEVSTSELRYLLPAEDRTNGTDRGQATRFGIFVRRLKDRVVRISHDQGELTVVVQTASERAGSARWRLGLPQGALAL